MGSFQLLDVAIGVVFIYALFALVVSSLNEAIANLLNSRAQHLYRGVAKLLGSSSGGESYVDKLYAHPLIQTLLREPVIALGARKKGGLPSYIHPDTFVSALLLQKWSSAMPARALASWADIENAIKALPEDMPIKVKLLEFAGRADSDMAKFYAAFNTWFDNEMNVVSNWYKQKTHKVTLVLAVAVAAAMNVDSIALVNTLSTNPAVRATVVAQAQLYAQEAPQRAASAPPPSDGAGAQQDKALELIKKTGLTFDWKGWQWSSKPTAAEKTALLWKCLGLLITALAISLGAPFWFDVLQKIISVRASGQTPAEHTRAKNK